MSDAAIRGSPRRHDKVDIDFSLAIHNRTGKYFIGRDLLAMADLPVGRTFYWGVGGSAPPTGIYGKVLGRLQLHHIRAHALGGAMRLLPRGLPKRPLLHLDPFTVPSTILRRCDAVLCHDLGHLTHPELFDVEVSRVYRPIFDEIAGVGPHMIFVSKASQAQFAALYPDARPSSTRHIYPAIRPGAVRTPPQAVPGIAPPFLLTVGSLGTRKNQLRCIQAFAQSGLAKAGVNYILCGTDEPGAVHVKAAALQTAGVRCLPYVSDAQLSWLYSSATGFVLVSQLEGFGMPVAEAISRGLIPLVTRDSVLHEVAGDGALLAGAEDIARIAEGMIELVHMAGEERGRRDVQLRQAIARFAPASIEDQWRLAFDEILRSAA